MGITLEWEPPAKFTQDWFSGREPAFREWLQPFKGQPISVLEIGAFEGRSTLFWLQEIATHPKSIVTVVDTWTGSADHEGMFINWEEVRKNFDWNTRKFANRLYVRQMASRDFFDFEKEVFCEPKYEVIYIDGSHTYDDLITDCRSAWPLLKEGGCLLIDDYWFDEQTEKAVNHFLFERIGAKDTGEIGLQYVAKLIKLKREVKNG